MPRTARAIVINGKWLAANPTGVQRYAGELVQRILLKDADAHVVVPADAVVPSWLPPERTTRSRARGPVFEQLALPWHARGRLLLNLAASGPLLVREQLIVMPDALVARYPETFSRLFVLWYSIMYRVLVRTARHVATISRFSRAELAEVLRVPPDRFTVIPAGHEHALGPAVAPTDPALLAAMQNPYFLCVGSLTPSKNLAPVTKALAGAGAQVIVVGASGVKRVYAEEMGLAGDGIHLAGRLSDAELSHVMRHAQALVFPSLYEGFGLPLIEAQAVACPVIASDRGSIPEVAADSVLFFDALDPAAAAALAVGLTADQREDLIARGRRNIERYRWDASADLVLSIARST